MTRASFLNRLIGIAGLGFFKLPDVQQMQKIYLLQCFVAGFRFHRGMELLPLMHEGDLLELRREPDNEHDAFAIALYWQQEMLGYLPRAQNETLARLMDAQALPLVACITHLHKEVKPWENVAVAVYFLQPQSMALPPHAAYLTRLHKPDYQTRLSAKKETEAVPSVFDECDRVIDLEGIEDEAVKAWFEKNYGHRRLNIPGGHYVLVPDDGIYSFMYNVDSIGWVKDSQGKRWLEFGWWSDDRVG